MDEKNLTDAEKLAIIKEAIVNLLSQYQMLDRATSLLSGDGTAADVADRVTSCNMGGGWFSAFFNDLDESGIVSDAVREILPKLLQRELKAAKVSIEWKE